MKKRSMTLFYYRSILMPYESGSTPQENILSGTPRETRAKKKVDVRFFYFFFIFIQVQVEKSLSLPGKKIKMFILKDMAKNRKKLFWTFFHEYYSKIIIFFSKLIF